jgi:ssDNA-binding Zn-finger/Zn-ribbon topoisomerase 1
MGEVIVMPSGIACKDCNEQISLARRRAIPGCKRCGDCQKERETAIKRARMGSRPQDIEIIRG